MSPAKPAWLPILEQQLKENPKCLAYAFSTLSQEGTPKVRHVIHRGFTPSSLLLTTTDTRMDKPAHLSHSSTIELAWWLSSTNVQFRITGQAYTIPLTMSLSDKEFNRVIDGLKVTGTEESQKEWWEGKRNELWQGVNGRLRAGFGRPSPGKRLEEVEDSSKWPETIPAKSDDPEGQKLVETAYNHFAIVAIRPEAVEFLELQPIPNRRTQWRWTKNPDIEDSGSWEEVKVAP
ncbi:hypothetical protein CNJ01800 [Cryptococcus deneoformans JEC21]|uniref:Pyridoxamine 5'-phosphate oxidase Alr4036 family FMN-binding domain-containing protein n=1 Tax=Cryptococcus deneoformans (strain JEC21 / ATCC MYA-565) TaxID=214684 RepID=Q5KAG3_CRYD1|nr:hypothetical protein CNJ01800 [Cryptococcus neoformans var. neoformans JEC21]AAW45838.2 hypothetical protein CNJ01800 [Cryptococcus neoformans var. neoformans JEC21]